MNYSKIIITVIISSLAFFAGIEVNQFYEIPIFNQSFPSISYSDNKNDSCVSPIEDIKFNQLEEVWSIMKEKYKSSEIFNEKKQFEYGMIKGIVYGLDDPFSAFMTPDENKNFKDSLQGNFEGIGAELTIRKNSVVVVTPLKGSPAKEAGIIPEDVIIKVNNEDITGLSLIDVVSKIRGEKGTEVTLNIFRPKSGEVLDIIIKRNIITVQSVESKMIENIAYIEISQFGNDTRVLFEKQIKELLKNNPKGIILDLRFNGGGYFEDSIEIASAFLKPEVDVVQIKERNNFLIRKSIYKSFTNTDLPLIVLINKGSASSSEILAGSLKDHKRAVLIGETSFGKGTVQEVVPISGGASLRITIAEWLTPNGNAINKEGIIPNIKIENTPEDHDNNKDTQLDKAIEIIKDPEWKKYIDLNPQTSVVKTKQ